MLDRLRRIATDPEWKMIGKWFTLATVVGIFAGFAAVVFRYLCQWLLDAYLGPWVAAEAGHLSDNSELYTSTDIGIPLWTIIVLPTVGGLISGWVVRTFAPEAQGHGTDAVLHAYHEQRGLIRSRVPLIKAIASSLTIGSGGSCGSEGPIAQIGAGLGSWLAVKLKLSVRDRRILLAAGMGAGVGATFRAPLAGALFAAEIHYRDPEFESETVVPSAIASIVGYCVFCLFHGTKPLLSTQGFGFETPGELLPYTILALTVSLTAWAYTSTFEGMGRFFNQLAIPPLLKPALGGLLTGLVAVILYVSMRDTRALAVMASGYGALQGALDGELSIRLLLVIALGKSLTTAMTIGSGGSGGVFGPSMVVGGAIGGAVGLALHALMPGLVPHPGAYVLVGMAGFFAGVAHTPISTIIMVSELTGNYALLLPALWVSMFCYLALRRVQLYSSQPLSRIDSAAHRGDFHRNILENITVGDVYDPSLDLLTFSENTSLGEILHRLSETDQTYYPITNMDGKLCGIFSINDLRAYMYEENIWDLALATDFATTDVVVVTPRDDLNTAIRRITSRNLDEIPIVAEHDHGHVIGMLSRKDMIDAYNQQLSRLGQAEQTIS